jgi:hypothetical protein
MSGQEKLAGSRQIKCKWQRDGGVCRLPRHTPPAVRYLLQEMLWEQAGWDESCSP